jgi:purine nucleoside permease
MRLLFIALMLAWISTPATAEVTASVPVRVVVITAFEIGEDTGDKAGEFQAWATAYPQKLSFPAGARDLRFDRKNGVLILNTGIGTARAATAVMALGTDPRFDLSRAYWLVAAIAGANPNETSVGSAAWIGQIIDTDYGYEIDSREIPAGWSTGRLPIDRTTPYQQPISLDSSSNLFPLNAGLCNWAYTLTRSIALPDNDTLRAIRSRYTIYPKALHPPSIMLGDEVTGQTFWHGKLLNDYAEEWTRYWTKGSGTFVMTAMEDSGVARALNVLGALGKVDAKRLMVLRTGSNYSVQAPGVTAAESLAHENSELSALQSSLDAAYLVGRKVVDEISGNWGKYADVIPGTVKAPSP